jgi:hypothetical protein
MQKYNLQKNPLKETKILQDPSTYIISLVLSGCDGRGCPFHPSVLSSIHPSSSSRKKKMMEEEEEEKLM